MSLLTKMQGTVSTLHLCGKKKSNFADFFFQPQLEPRMKRSAILFICLLGLALSDKGSDDDRNVTPVNQNGDECSFDSTSRGVDQDRIRFSLDRKSDVIRLKVKGFSHSQDVKSFVHADVEIHSIIEYNETNGVPGFQQGVDQVVSQITMKSLSFNDISCSAEAAGFRCVLSSTNGEISCTAFIAKQISNFSGSAQDPASVKFSINITKADKKDGDLLALEARVRVQSHFSREVEGQNGTEKHYRFGPSTFSWVETAEVENRTCTVIASNATLVRDDDSKDDSDDDDDDQTECKVIFFSFLDAGKGLIFWDPSLAYDASLARASSSATLIPSLFLLALLALFAYSY
jgi:hypothetical protein